MNTNRRLATGAALALAALLTGCVQSFHPFCTPEVVVPVPELAGQWDVVQPTNADDMFAASTNRPWLCTALQTGLYQVVTYGTNEVPATLLVATFKVADQLYCDTTAGESDEHASNPYWNSSITRVHNLWKLSLSNDVLSLRALDLDWLRRAGKSNLVALAYVSETAGDQGGRLYTARPAEWVEFLKKFGAQAEVFADDPAFVLRKRAAAPNPAPSPAP